MSDARRAHVVVLDVAAVTAVGDSATASGAAFRASLSGFTLHESPRVAGDEAFTLAAVPSLPPVDLDDHVASSAPRMRALVERAAVQLVAHDASTALFLGVPSPRTGLSASDTHAVVEHAAQALRARGFAPNLVETFALDHAGGLAALERAYRAIEGREVELCVVGGVDSYLCEETLVWLHTREQLKSRHNRWGFVAGEGACLLVVASREFAEARRLRVLAEVLAVARGHEAVPPRTREPQTAVGLSAALRTVIRTLPNEAEVDEVYSDHNGERWRGDELGFAMPRIAARLAAHGRLLTPSVAVGDVGAAAGPLLIATAVHLAQRGAARGPTILALTSADHGARAVALLSLPICARE